MTDGPADASGPDVECPERSRAIPSERRESRERRGAPPGCHASIESIPLGPTRIALRTNIVFHTYILRCGDGSYYTGSCRDLSARIAAHRRGEAAAWTALRRPVEVVHSERFDTRSEAVARERQIKRWSRAKKHALATGDIDRLRSSARGHKSNRAGGVKTGPDET